MDFKNQVKDEKIWASEGEIQNVPGIIRKEYELLKENIQKDDICGALFRLKDIYEISMKLPCIIAIISISSYVEDDNDFIKMTCEELKKEHEEYLSEEKNVNVESEVLKKFGNILSLLLEKPLSIGSWHKLAKTIVEHSAVFEINGNLKEILERTIKLHEVRPKKVNGEKGRYDNVSNWRNKTIGHGTLLINTDDYWEQVYDMVKGLDAYFRDDENEVSLSDLYSHIVIERDEGNETCNDRLIIGEKEYSISEYIYSLDDEQYFFDSYYSRENYTEITNYISAPKRLKNNKYYQTLYSLFNATKKGRAKKKGRQISNSADREMYACLNSIPSYEKPSFVIDKIRDFINENDKGILYIQMERGMGKSTLAHRLDGRYQKGILQEELDAVVRVYHISDMLLRGENKTRDYFTALNNNLISYEGGQLEVDNEEYYVDGKDLRQLMEGDGEEASLSFCQYLELFRSRYEEEIEDDDSKEVNLVYIIDGIDELNSDTFSILNTIPYGKQMQSIFDELVNHVYIVLLSRTKDEDNLPVIAKECIESCEKKANMVYKIDSNDEDYYQLLKNYIARNYKKISEESVCEIIEKAQRKFLYIQPYMAIGDSVITPGVKITAYDVAKNYISELQKLYCGTSLHTLQLIISSIAVLHSVSLKEVCKLVVFTDVSYDVIGILNDILPLLATRRTDGEDIYEYANEEYEQYIFENMYEAVCEVICRYRISIESWFNNIKKTYENAKDIYDDITESYDNYAIDWAKNVSGILRVDRVAKEIGFTDTTEDYVKTLLYLGEEECIPSSVYARNINHELECNIITHIRQLQYKKLEVLKFGDLKKQYLYFDKFPIWQQERYEYTQEVINHCIEMGEVDEWFKLVIYLDRTLTQSEQRLKAFRRIVESWKDHEPVVDYIYNLVKKEIEKKHKFPTYSVYLEELIFVVKDNHLRKKLYEGLVNSYTLLANDIQMFTNDTNNLKKDTILKILEDAEEFNDLDNYNEIRRVKEIFCSYNMHEHIYDETAKKLEELAKKINYLEPMEYFIEFNKLRLENNDVGEKQIEKYRHSQDINYEKLLIHLRSLFDKKDIEGVALWLGWISYDYFNNYIGDYNEVFIDYLNMYYQVIAICVEEKNDLLIRSCSHNYKNLLRYYDDKVRQNPIGLYRDNYRNRIIDEKQKMTLWEKQYALYCSCEYKRNYVDCISESGHYPINNFTNQLLQELFDDNNLEKYFDLNNKIAREYARIDFCNNYIRKNKIISQRDIRHYYRWMVVRYYRSIDGKDVLSTHELSDWLTKECNLLMRYICEKIRNESELLYNGSGDAYASYIGILSIELLNLAKMLPDSICSVEATRAKLLNELDEVIKKSSNKRELKTVLNEIKSRILDHSEWCNSEKEFIITTTDRTIFEK